jgi:Tol biopolymer transport system component
MPPTRSPEAAPRAVLLVALLAPVAAAMFAAAGVAAASGSEGDATPSAERLAGAAVCPPRAGGRTELVNVSTEGQQADARVLRATVSAKGRFIAFSSAATNLVPGDTNRYADVFVRDLVTRTTTRVSVSSAGGQGNAASYFPSISADGRMIAFRSLAKNLVEDDTNAVEDVFLHDMLSGVTQRVSVGSAGQQANGASITTSISADGTVVAFTSAATNLVPGDRNNVNDVFVRDTTYGQTIRVTAGPRGEANGVSEGSGISSDGNLVTFRSFATNLVRADGNGLADVFVRDWVARTTERVNVSTSGAEANGVTFRGAISGDGRRVAFRSRATNLVDGDTNEALDVFEHDRVTGVTRRISIATSGAQADGRALPPAARAASFMSRAFLSATGRYATFGSRAPNLVAGDTNRAADVFVHDLVSRRTARVSVTAAGTQANDDSFVVGVSGDGSVIVFVSSASNLVSNDTNDRRDAFVRLRALSRPAPPCIWPPVPQPLRKPRPR